MTAYVARAGTAAEIGGKAASLAAALAAGLPVPPWFALRAAADLDPDAPLPDALRAELCDAVRALAPDGEPLAVRSSAVEEDGVAHSFAGQFESFLHVPPAEVPDRVREVWRAARSERVAAYRRQHGLGPGALPAVLVQRMVQADAAGVAFSADPVSGRRGVAVDAPRVAGDLAGDEALAGA